MQKYILSLIPIIVAAAVAVAPQVQGALGHHPVASVIVGAAYAILAHWAPSPAQS
jgi:hypothetical protein